MNATAAEPQPATTSTGADEIHVYCCDPDLSLCGLDISDLPEVDDETTCVVCADLNDIDRPCSPRCPGGDA